MFVEHFLAFSGAFMHFWVKRFESLFERFESLFERFESLSLERFLIVRKCFSDSNPSLNDSNLFSSSQNILKRFESLFRGFESFCKKPKNFKIINRRFESLFRGFESPCLLKCETVHFLQKSQLFHLSFKNFSLNPPLIYSKSVFKPKISSIPTLIPILYHHFITQNTRINHESSTFKGNKHQTHYHGYNERTKQRAILQILTNKTTM